MSLRSTYKSLFYLCCLLIIGETPLFATKYYINDASTTGDIYCTSVGNAGNNGLSTATPKLSLLNLLTTYSASFASGDTIFIDAGSYSDKDLSSPQNGVVIKGAGPSSTIFTNPGSDNYFMRIDDNNTILHGMTLKNFDDMGGGLGQVLGVAANKTGVKILNVVVSSAQQTSTASGYPIEVAAGANVIFSGGGSQCSTFSAGGAMHIAAATVGIYSYLFVGTYQNSNEGTALSVAGGTVTVNNSLFDNNTAAGDHHGAAIYVSSGSVKVYDCIFNANKTTLSANAPGGSVLIAGGTFTITRSVIKNHSQLGGSTSYGAGIAATGGTVTIDSCLFTSNSGSRGNDVHNKGGTILARNCTFGSSANQIGVNSGVANSFSITTCGSPGITTTSGSVQQIDNNAPTYTANPVTPTYSGTCGTSIIILPVELVDFRATCSGTNISLNWVTITERNNHFFEVERSDDGIVFTPISRIEGNGTGNQIHHYSYYDNDVLSSIGYYYRLKQVDYNGNFSYSNITDVLANCNQPNLTVEIYPNPFESNFSVNIPITKPSEVEIKVYNQLGQLVQSVKEYKADNFSSIRISVALNDLTNGIYFVNTSVNSIPIISKIVKYSH